MTNSGLTLGQLVDELRKHDTSRSVCFDFCGLAPDEIHSYRGYYEDLCISWEDSIGAVSAGKLADQLEAAIGNTFPGYKGGEFRMDRGTTLWVADWGMCSNTIITGVDDTEFYPLTLLTGFEAH